MGVGGKAAEVDGGGDMATTGQDRIGGYKDLKVWQRGMDLAQAIYMLTSRFPKSQEYGLAVQMRRASVSVPSNIAEGYGRNATGEYRHHLCIARGSLLELETQVILSQRVGLLRPELALTRPRFLWTRSRV